MCLREDGQITDPIRLPCAHVFCCHCLREHFAHSAVDRMWTRSGVRVQCPTCHETHLMQEDQLDGTKTMMPRHTALPSGTGAGRVASTPPVSGSSDGNADGDGGEQAVSAGDRISVYWPDDGKWYDGRVHSEVAAGWWVHYDDGDKQVHDLKAERYKVQAEAQMQAQSQMG